MLGHMTEHMHNSELIGTAEAADILGVSITTVNRWAVQGKINPATPSHNRGARFYDRATIEHLAEQAKPKVSL